MRIFLTITLFIITLNSHALLEMDKAKIDCIEKTQGTAGLVNLIEFYSGYDERFEPYAKKLLADKKISKRQFREIAQSRGNVLVNRSIFDDSLSRPGWNITDDDKRPGWNITDDDKRLTQ